jgi:hypothetical protein
VARFSLNFKYIPQLWRCFKDPAAIDSRTGLASYRYAESSANNATSEPRYQLDLVCGRALRSNQAARSSSFSEPSAAATIVATSSACDGSSSCPFRYRNARVAKSAVPSAQRDRSGSPQKVDVAYEN